MSGGSPEPAEIVDALGLLCPLPIARTKQAIARVRPGDVVLLWADDDEIERDLPAWCAGSGHEMVSLSRAEGPRGRPAWRGLVKKRLL